MRLMQGYETKSGAVGVEDLDRWPPDSLAFRFLPDIDKYEAAELLNVRG